MIFLVGGFQTCQAYPLRRRRLWSVQVCRVYAKLGGLPGGSDGQESTCHVGDLGSFPGLGITLGGGHGSPLQYSFLDNPRDRGAWRAAVHGVAKNWT